MTQEDLAAAAGIGLGYPGAFGERRAVAEKRMLGPWTVLAAMRFSKIPGMVTWNPPYSAGVVVSCLRDASDFFVLFTIRGDNLNARK